MVDSDQGQDQRGEPRTAAQRIVRTIQQRGHTAYLAGGCVRDRLLDRTPKDYDVATDARPEQVRKLFRRTQYVGEAFGVVLVQLWGCRIEVATFRAEWGYADGRHPEHVDFSDAKHDARRRDFTVNGLFEDPITGKIIDFVGGREDLKAGVIRAIGVPDERFGEDYLRMLRAVRFAASLDFTIERRTAAAIRKHAAKLNIISRERTGQEVAAMLTGPRPAAAAKLLQRLALDEPALGDPHSTATLPTLSKLEPGCEYPTPLCAWAIDRYLMPHVAGKAQPLPALAKRIDNWLGKDLAALLRRWRKALCLSNDHRDAMRATLSLLPTALDWARLPVAQRKRLLAQPMWPGTRALLRALKLHGATAFVRRLEREAQPLEDEGVAPKPLVNGDDLIRMGRRPGPSFSRLLRLAYDAQLEGRVRTRHQALRLLKQLS